MRRRIVRAGLAAAGAALAAAVVLAAAAAAWLDGHTPGLAVPRPPELPDHPTAVEHWVNRAESRFPDIVDGTAARIVWGRPRRPAITPVSIVYLHGFSATRRETAPLVERLARGWRANAYEARLAGHGRDFEALAGVEASDWLGDARTALAVGRALGERVLVIGCSTGATLAAWLASRPDQSGVLGYVLLSPNLAPRNPLSDLLLLPGAKSWAPWVHGAGHRFEVFNDRHARYWTERVPTPSLVEMMRLVDFVRDRDFGDVGRPVLTLVDPGDRVVDTRAVRDWHATLGAPRKRLATIDSDSPGRHVLAGEILSPATTDDVLRAIRAFFDGGAPAGASR